VSDTVSEATKMDQDRPRYDLIPILALEQVAEVFRFGAGKYGERNWETGLRWGRLWRAAISHLVKFWRGETNDDESGLPHLAHAAASVLMLIDTTLRHPQLDSRPLPLAEEER
jgi:Domain of unknown function (DUF5664)